MAFLFNGQSPKRILWDYSTTSDTITRNYSIQVTSPEASTIIGPNGEVIAQTEVYVSEFRQTDVPNQYIENVTLTILPGLGNTVTAQDVTKGSNGFLKIHFRLKTLPKKVSTVSVNLVASVVLESYSELEELDFNGTLVWGKYQDYVFEDNGDNTWSIGAKNNLSGDIVLPQTYRNKPITTIKEDGFMGQSITSIYIPEGYTTISRNAFETCTLLKKVYLPDSLVEIEPYAFVECYELAAVGFGNSPIIIGVGAFEECYSLKALHIPMVDEIADDAFSGTGIEHLYLGLSTANRISDAIGLPPLKSFYIDWTTAESTQDIIFPSHEKIYSGYLPFDRELDGLEYTDMGDDTVSVCWNSLEGAPSALYFPLTDRWGRPIVKVGLFEGMNQIGDGIATIKNIHIPMTVSEIVSGAFGGQQNVDTFQFDNPEAEIGTGIFVGQDTIHLVGSTLGLKSIVAPFVGDRMDGQNTFIGWWFTHNVDDILEANRATPKNLARVTLVEGITSLSDEAFASSRVDEVYLPDSITSIGTKCFNNSSLSSIRLPESLEEIPQYALSSTNLTGILIPHSVTDIMDYAFSGCYQLNQVIFPLNSSLFYIFPYAFQNCSSLKTITIPASVGYIAATVFDSTDDRQFIESVAFDWEYWYHAVAADNTQDGGDGFEYTYENFVNPTYQAGQFSGGNGIYYRTDPVVINGLTLQSDNKTIVANITNPNGCPLTVSMNVTYKLNSGTKVSRGDTNSLAKNSSGVISMTIPETFNSAIVTIFVEDYQGDGLTASLEIQGSGATDQEETTT